MSRSGTEILFFFYGSRILSGLHGDPTSPLVGLYLGLSPPPSPRYDTLLGIATHRGRQVRGRKREEGKSLRDPVGDRPDPRSCGPKLSAIGNPTGFSSSLSQTSGSGRTGSDVGSLVTSVPSQEVVGSLSGS